jgi:hypothetical protein
LQATIKMLLSGFLLLAGISLLVGGFGDLY